MTATDDHPTNPEAPGTVLLERHGGIALLILNRPNKLNALNARVQQELFAHLESIREDDSLRVVVITGAGEKAFAAGADIGEFAGRSPVDQRQAMEFPRMFDIMMSYPKPVIAMIRGYCLGGGCELVSSCDIRIAADDARFGQPEVNLGLLPGGGGTQRLPRLIGTGQTLRLCLSGEMIDAQEALRIGLVEQVVPADELRQRTFQLAEAVAAKSPVALRLNKEAVRAAERLPVDEGMRYERDLFCLAFSTEDKEEGVAAFLEKRKPQWRGR
ncbi:MAG: enoyl-CoA hydratase-related protein [Acidobacteriota bacterium]